jgi:hypothetical protein
MPTAGLSRLCAREVGIRASGPIKFRSISMARGPGVWPVRGVPSVDGGSHGRFQINIISILPYIDMRIRMRYGTSHMSCVHNYIRTRVYSMV